MTEPMSKCELLAAIRCHAKVAIEEDTASDAAFVAGDIHACEGHLVASIKAVILLLADFRQAETSGLFDELSGYLTASYGG